MSPGVIFFYYIVVWLKSSFATLLPNPNRTPHGTIMSQSFYIKIDSPPVAISSRHSSREITSNEKSRALIIHVCRVIETIVIEEQRYDWRSQCHLSLSCVARRARVRVRGHLEYLSPPMLTRMRSRPPLRRSALSTQPPGDPPPPAIRKTRIPPPCVMDVRARGPNNCHRSPAAHGRSRTIEALFPTCFPDISGPLRIKSDVSA